MRWAWEPSCGSGWDALALASGSHDAPADGDLVRFRVRPELHVLLHGLLQLLLAVHRLADVGLELPLEDLPIEMVVPELQRRPLLLEVGPDQGVVVGTVTSVLRGRRWFWRASIT
jgi:hypothetical protein